MKDKLFDEMTDEQFKSLMKKVIPQQIAEEMVSVQPLDNIDFKALSEDPLASAMLSNMVKRTIDK